MTHGSGCQLGDNGRCVRSVVGSDLSGWGEGGWWIEEEIEVCSFG